MKKAKPNIALTGLILVTPLLLILGCPRNINERTFDKEAQVLIYQRHCAHCHGNRGDVGTDSVYLNESDMSEDQIAEATRYGVGMMPGYDDILTDEEIEAVSNYVYEFLIHAPPIK